MFEVIISSSILILIVILLRFIFGNKISRRFRYAMWSIILLRLLIPVQFFSSPISVMNIISDDIPSIIYTERVVTPDVSEFDPAIPAPVVPDNPESNNIQNNVDQQYFDKNNIEKPNSFPFISQNLLFSFWLIGVIIVAGWFIISNLKLYRELRTYRRPINVNGSRLPVYYVDELLSPCLFGLLKPSIYLTPKSIQSQKSIDHVMTHELTHYIQKDHLWAILRGACVAIYWFNPLVWIAAWLSRSDCELSCDEAAVKGMGDETRIDYGRTLVTMISIKRKPDTVLCAATTMSSGTKKIKKRLQMIIDNKKSMIPILLISTLIIIIAAFVTFTSALESDNFQHINVNDPIDVQSPGLGVRAISIRHDGHVLPVGLDGFDFTIRSGEEVTLLALLEPLGVDGEIVWVVDDVNILKIIYIDIDTTEATIKAINSGTTKLSVIAADLIETITVRVVGYDNDELSEPEPIEPIRYRIITEQPTDDFYIMFFLTLNGQLPLYIAFEEAFKIEFTSLLDDELTTDVISLDKSLNVDGIPLGYYMMYNNTQWDIWSNSIFVSYDPNQAEFVSFYNMELFELLQDLMDYIGIIQFDSYMIRNIISAEIKNVNSGIDGFYDVIITDTDKLADIEAVFSNLIYEASGCPFNDVLLFLTTSTGDVIPLAMASDSCNVFFFNGQYFKFNVPGRGITWYEYFTDHLDTAEGDN